MGGLVPRISCVDEGVGPFSCTYDNIVTDIKW